MLHFKGISYSFLQYKYLLKKGTGGVGYALGHSLPQDWQDLVPLKSSDAKVAVFNGPMVVRVWKHHTAAHNFKHLAPSRWHHLEDCEAFRKWSLTGGSGSVGVGPLPVCFLLFEYGCHIATQLPIPTPFLLCLLHLPAVGGLCPSRTLHQHQPSLP